jgi:hypothetical protein
MSEQSEFEDEAFQMLFEEADLEVQEGDLRIHIESVQER